MKVKTTDIVIQKGFNPRTDFVLDKPLLNSVKEMGLINPLTVVKTNGKYTLLDGERRFRVVKKLNWLEVEVDVKQYTPQQQSQIPTITNITKNLLSLGDKATGIKQLTKHFDDKTIGNMLDLSIAEVKRYHSLAKLPTEILCELNKGKIALDQAVLLCQIKEQKIQLKIVKRMAEEGEMFFEALSEFAYSVPFKGQWNEVMAYQKNQPLILINGEPYTLNKNFAEAVYEYCRQYDQEQAHKQEEQQEKEEPKQKRGSFKVQRELQAKLQQQFKNATIKLLTHEPSKKLITEMIVKFCGQLSIDDKKLMLRAFGVEFVAKDLTPTDYAAKTDRILTTYIKNVKRLPNLIRFVDMMRDNGMGKCALWDLNKLKYTIEDLRKGV